MLIFRQKSFQFCTPPLENSTTRITILYMHVLTCDSGRNVSPWKKIDYAKKTHQSFFCLFAELGHPYTTYTAERKSFRSSCSPGGGGPKVVYMSSCFLQLAVGSHDLSQAEKEITVCKADQIHKKTSILLKMTISPDYFELSFCKFAQLCKQLFLP